VNDSSPEISGILAEDKQPTAVMKYLAAYI
jgi:hypothetical protein